MRSRVLTGLLAASLLLSATPAGAHDPSSTVPTLPPETLERQREIEDRIRRLEGAVGEASAAEARLLGELTSTQARLDTIDARIRAIDAQLAEASGRLAIAEAEVNRLDGRYVGLTRQLRDLTRSIDEARDDLSAVAVELYRRAGDHGRAWAALTLDAATPAELFAGTRYLAQVASAERARIRDLERLEARVLRLREDLERERDAARAARDVVAAERTRVAALLDEQERARGQVAAVVEQQERVLAEIRRRRDEFNAEIAALRAESNSIAAMLRELQSGQAPAPTGTGTFLRPVGAPITSGFGMRVHPILGTTRMHTGVDFGAPAGTPIRAAGEGTVVWAGLRGGYGNTVIIDHGNSLATLYAHLSRVAAGSGQVVERGQVIGAVGSTGLSTGPHLHFEVRVRGTPVDPLPYL